MDNQSSYKNQQQFKIDVRTLYNYFIKSTDNSKRGVDDYRSRINIKGATKSNIIKALQNGYLRSILNVESAYQESRCHAFYRILGLPVYDGSRFYNPGYDNTFSNKILTFEDKKTIAANSINATSGSMIGFMKLSDARESIPLTFNKIFANTESINASILALSSINKRNFSDPLINITNPESVADNMDSEKQSYYINMDGQVGNYKLNLETFIGNGGTTSTLPSSITTRKHIVYPFLVDARYSESVNIDNMVAVPFTLYERNLQASETVKVQIPMIESIITDRLKTINIDDSATLQTMKDYITNSSLFKLDESLFNTILSDYNYSQQKKFIEYSNIMNAIIDTLCQAFYVINITKQQFYWLPIPSAFGPESGCNIRPIMLSEELAKNSNFITQSDYELIKASIANVATQTSSMSTNVNIFPELSTIFNPSKTDVCGNNVIVNVDQLNVNRNYKIKTANDALQIIEMVMGEFSGFGLCDILAVIASLYVISQESLLGFLDDDAFNRMQTKLNITVSSKNDLETSLAELTKTVNNFYNLMDKIYINKSQKASLASVS
jgi:hypothetical protein